MTDWKVSISLSLGYAYESAAVAQIIFGGVFNRFPELIYASLMAVGVLVFLQKDDKLAKFADKDFDYLGMVKIYGSIRILRGKILKACFMNLRIIKELFWDKFWWV